MRVPATTRAERQRYQALLTRLYDEQQLDVLRAIKGGLPLEDVRVEVERTGDFGVANLMSRLLLRRDLWATLGAAHARLGTSPTTRKRYATTFTKLARVLPIVPGKLTVAALASVDWRDVRARWTVTKGYGERARERAASSADWNHVRRFLSAALTDLFGGGRTGRAHPFRQKVLDAFASEREYGREVTLTLDEFANLATELPVAARAPVMMLALTGIRLGEYLALTPDALNASACTITVQGKTGPGVVKVEPSLWPWIVAAVPPPVASATGVRAPFRKAAAAIGHPGLRLHDLRHLNATAALAAGAALGAVRDQLRHADAKTTMRYVAGANRSAAAEALARAFAPVLKIVGGG